MPQVRPGACLAARYLCRVPLALQAETKHIKNAADPVWTDELRLPLKSRFPLPETGMVGRASSDAGSMYDGNRASRLA